MNVAKKNNVISKNWKEIDYIDYQTPQFHAVGITMDYTLNWDEDEEYGSFEFYDEESGGLECHAEGGLWFEGKRLVDYDGVFELPKNLLDTLKKMGANVEDIE